MNSLEQHISSLAKAAVKALYGVEAEDSQIQLQKTRSEFEGNITLVVFPFVKLARKAPAQVAAEIGEWLKENGEGLIAKYNAVQGFLNLVIGDEFWINQLEAIDADDQYGHNDQMVNDPYGKADRMNEVNKEMVNKSDQPITVGRHDACVATRAVPVVEAMTALALINLLD